MLVRTRTAKTRLDAERDNVREGYTGKARHMPSRKLARYLFDYAYYGTKQNIARD